MLEPHTSGRRRLLTAAAATGTLTLLGAGCSASGARNDEQVPGTAGEQQRRNEQLVREAFAQGVSADRFYTILADDVQWTIARAEPSTYTNRQQFLTEGAAPITDRLTGPIQADVREILAADDRVAVWWDGTATALDGEMYVNTYFWLMTLRDDRVVRVVAFLDLVALADLLDRVDLPR